MKEFAEKFYKSKRWQHCRNAYMKSVGGMCEECMKRGIYKPAEIVHHKIHITPVTIHQPEVTLSWSNLEALCRDCHRLEHPYQFGGAHPVDPNNRKGRKGRYAVNPDGTVVIM